MAEVGVDSMVKLTIGMPTYNDFDGVSFTLQALRFYQYLAETELLVVDNDGCEHTYPFGVKGPCVLAIEPGRHSARYSLSMSSI